LKAVDFLLDTLALHGVDTIFGNPGTTEIPLVRACERGKKLRYIVALSELAAVPMADGYARARRAFGVVNLHVAPGFGNGMGALYTAGIAGTPLLVLVGSQDRRFLHTEPILWGPVENMAATVCKAVFTLTSRHDTAANIRRALRAVLTPPYAPVALVCPPDVLEHDIPEEPAAVRAPELSGLNAATIEDFANFLSGAKHPAIIAAEDVHWSAAGEEKLSNLAEHLSAPVYAAPYTAVLPISAESPWYAGYLPPSFKQISERLEKHDALLFLGGRGLRTTLYSETALPQRKAWIGTDTRIQPPEGEFELAAVADIAHALRALDSLLSGRPRAKKTKAPGARPAMEVPAAKRGVFHPTRAVAALLEQFSDAIWFDESGLSTSDVRQWMKLPAGEYIVNGSGGIGWGLPASVGGAIAKRNRQVVAIVGDGSALYASEAMWTAAHVGTNMLLVVLSNRRYATLNEAAGRLAGGALESFTIEPPVLDFSGLAKLYGWTHTAVATEDELVEFLAGANVHTNTLLELKLDPAVKPITASRHF
jgi:benzoylformate decarboxylase